MSHDVSAPLSHGHEDEHEHEHGHEHSHARQLLTVLEALFGVAAVVGGALLVVEPSGALLRMSPSILRVFGSFLVPGLLLIAVGLFELAAALLTWRRHRASMLVSQAAGALLVLWICFQSVLVRPLNALQLIALAVGGLIFILAHELHRDEHREPSAEEDAHHRPQAGLAR